MLCLYFPQLLTTPELRAHYPVAIIRLLIQGLIWSSLLFGTIGSLLRKKKVLALCGLGLATVAALLGGANVKLAGELSDGPAIGLDYFLLDLFATALIYVPLERIWPRYPAQSTFRPQWTLDIIYFISTHIPVQVVSFLVLLPATEATRYLAIPQVAQFIASLPLLVQFFLAVIVADIAEWAIHFALHKVPFLWRFHSIHHSSKALDWIAGSRSHVVDDILLRGLILVPNDARLFSRHHAGVPDFRDLACHVDALQLRANRQMARAIPGDAQIPSLASLLPEGGHRQKLRDPFSLDRSAIWDLLLSPALA